MTLPLRRRHLFIFTVLLLLLPTAFWAGFHYRQPAAVSRPLPSNLVPRALPEGTELISISATWDLPTLESRFHRSTQGDLFVELIPHDDLQQPDLLLYWSQQPSPDGKDLPSPASLLGAYSGSRAQAFALPALARQSGGTLLLYSLAHRQVFSSLHLPEGLSRGGR